LARADAVELERGMISAADERWDIVILGAGPAGSVAAFALARAGHTVLLVDKAKFPRPKVCGCCLNARGLAALDELGLGDAVRAVGGMKLAQLTVSGRGRSLTVSLPEGLSLSRAVLDATLARQAVEAGARFEDGTAGEVLPLENQPIGPARNDATAYRRVRLTHDKGQRTVTAPLVLAADGLAGSSLKQLTGFDWQIAPGGRIGLAGIGEAASMRPPAGTIAMAIGQGGYVGRVQLPDGRTDLAAAMTPGLVRQAGGKGPAVDRLLKQAMPNGAGLAERVNWQGVPALTRRRPVAGPRLLVLGDAAGYVEPFTGEGMSWAIRSGAAAASLAERGLIEGWDERLAQQWRQRYRRTVRAEQRICRALARLLRHERLIAGGLGLLRQWPALMRWPVRRACEPAPLFPSKGPAQAKPPGGDHQLGEQAWG
jgi:flavin-dependent dehydrogenase